MLFVSLLTSCFSLDYQNLKSQKNLGTSVRHFWPATQFIVQSSFFSLFLFFSYFKMLFHRRFKFETYHQSSKHLACKTWGILMVLLNAAVQEVGGDRW